MHGININFQEINNYKVIFPQSRDSFKYKKLKKKQEKLIFLFKNYKNSPRNYNSILTELQNINFELIKFKKKHSILYTFYFISINLENSINYLGVNRFNLIMVNPHLWRLASNYKIQGFKEEFQNLNIQYKGVSI